MSKYAPPDEPCPYCGAMTQCETVDVGVGFVQAGPYHCYECGATEAGAYDDKPEDLARIDPQTRWFPPGEMPGSSANVIGGKLASVNEATAAYRAAFAGNPLYDVPGVVEAWWEQQRKPGGPDA